MSIDYISKVTEEEVDLHKLILIIGRSWLTLTVFILIGGMLSGLYLYTKNPTYAAQAVILIDNNSILGNINPLYLIRSDQIQSKVAQTLNLTLDDLSAVTVTQDTKNNTIIFIKAETDNQQLSIDLVNTWAEFAIQTINYEGENLHTELDLAQQSAISADSTLITYLYKNGLGDLSWADLITITGVRDQLNTVIINDENPYPYITAKQRLELSDLVRQKKLAEWNYDQVSQSILSTTNFTENRAQVINKAIDFDASNQLSTYLIIPLGVLCGFLLAIIWILLKDWWKNSQQKIESEKSPQ